MPYHWPEDQLNMPKRRRRPPVWLALIIFLIAAAVIWFRSALIYGGLTNGASRSSEPSSTTGRARASGRAAGRWGYCHASPVTLVQITEAAAKGRAALIIANLDQGEGDDLAEVVGLPAGAPGWMVPRMIGQALQVRTFRRPWTDTDDKTLREQRAGGIKWAAIARDGQRTQEAAMGRAAKLGIKRGA